MTLLLTTGSLLAQAEETQAQDPPSTEQTQDVVETPTAIDEDDAPVEIPIPQVPLAELEIRSDPFLIDQFNFQYAREHPQHPDLSSLQDVEVELGVTTTGYIAPREGIPTRTFRIGDLPNLELQQFYFSAMNVVFVALVEHLRELDLISVYIAADPREISPIDPFEDFRPLGESNPLTIQVITAIINQTRTLAFGDRIPDVDRENNPLHQGIIDRSPLKSWDGEGEREDLLRRRELNDYLARLNRLPGRRVDAAIAAVDKQPGEVSLDFLVSENNTLQLYAQVSNTGTDQTDEIRMRFGLIMNQFTDNDDILSIEYVTASFDESHAVIGDYTTPIGDSDVWWMEFNGFWSDYTASDVGFANEQFSGESWAAGADLVYNIYQKNEFFLDLVAGARWLNVKVTNDIVDIEGETDFFLPNVGIRFERRTSVISTEGFVHVTWNMPDVADTDEDELDALGRLFVDDDWTMLRWSGKTSFYLEPLLNRKAWEDIDSRDSSTLAHELYFHFRGQYAFDNRLVPQTEQVIGGLYTVRGYEESIVAGDSVYIATAEYRLHLAKAFPYDENPGMFLGRKFRRVPQEPYGSADWDFIIRAFIDYGYAEVSDALSFENDTETLIGAGIGCELSLYRNINVRLDWGFVLRDVDEAGADAGDNKLHVVATFIF